MISTRSVELVIDTVVCLTLAKWETVSGQFGGYLTYQPTIAFSHIIRAGACRRKKHPVRAVEQMLRFLPQAMAAGQKASIALLALSAMLLLAPIQAAERRAEQSPPALIVDAPNSLPVQPRRSHSTAAGHSGPKQGCVTAIMFPRAFGQ